MAALPQAGSYAPLWDLFVSGAVMKTYLIVYIVGHLLAYVLLGIALRRARIIPLWAAWSMIASSPLTMAVFVLPGKPVWIGVALLVIGSLPAAWVGRRPANRLSQARTDRASASRHPVGLAATPSWAVRSCDPTAAIAPARLLWHQ
jgi:membrane protein implicated in regulation of membrane protease activity